MATILICGHRAYAARGLKTELEALGHNVLEYSRGEVARNDSTITGPVLNIDDNPLFTERIDFVINFIVLQQNSLEENIAYIDALLRFCRSKGVKRLIQISSISAYPNDALLIKENTLEETDLRKKGGYGMIKSAVDIRLERARREVDFDIIFVRPGYIVAGDNPHPFKGVAKFVGENVAILLGNRKSTLPCISRNTFHRCLSEIVTQNNPLPVYLLIEGKDTTKLSYFKSQSKAFIIPLPKWLFVLAANVAKELNFISEETASGIIGVFKVQMFDNCITKNKLRNLK